jgi:hypothetical protein
MNLCVYLGLETLERLKPDNDPHQNVFFKQVRTKNKDPCLRSNKRTAKTGVNLGPIARPTKMKTLKIIKSFNK